MFILGQQKGKADLESLKIQEGAPGTLDWKVCRKLWHGLTSYYSPAAGIVRSRFTEGEAMIEERLLWISIWALWRHREKCICAQAMLTKCPASTWILLWVIDKCGALWERDKFYMASPLTSFWLSLRPVGSLGGSAEVCVLLQVLNSVQFGVVMAKGASSELCTWCWWRPLCHKGISPRFCGLHCSKCLFEKLFIQNSFFFFFY